MITLTVGLSGGDFTSLAAALATLTGTTLADDTKILFIDKGPYHELNTIESIVTSPTKRLIIEGEYDRGSRTRLWNLATGWLINVKISNTVIKGLFIDRQEDLDDNRSGIRYWTGTANHDICYNHIFGAGWYWEDGVTCEVDVTNVNFYNNLCRRWGGSCIYFDTLSANNEVYNIYNNTFIKSQEDIWIADYSTYTMSNQISVWNNIFDMDLPYEKECIVGHAILVPDGIKPDDFKKLDYNHWVLRGGNVPAPGLVQDWFGDSDGYSIYTLAAFQTFGAETHGTEGDPKYFTYCSDYHLLTTSPCIQTADGNIPSDDNDTELREVPGWKGCYECNPLQLRADPQFDLMQNSTMWVELEDLRTSGAERTLSASLDVVRIL